MLSSRRKASNHTANGVCFRAQQTKMLLKKLKYYFLIASVLSFCSVFLQCVLDRREDAAGLKEGLAGVVVWQESSTN